MIKQVLISNHIKQTMTQQVINSRQQS